MRHKTLSLLVPLIFTLACGGGSDNNLTGPSTTFPNVAGSYSGTTAITFPEVSRTLNCPTTTAVTQSAGGNISIAPIQIRCPGEAPFSLPVGAATISINGSFANDSGSLTESCGRYDYTASGGFFGRELRVTGNYTSRTCLNMNISINLTRS